jgi:hypothetical protein
MFGRKRPHRKRFAVKNVGRNLKIAEKKNHELHNTASEVSEIANDIALGAGTIAGVSAATGIGAPIGAAAGAIAGVAKGVGVVAGNVENITGKIDQFGSKIRSIF